MRTGMYQHPTEPALRRGAAYDVIVVGARAAGAATAMLLARSGLDVLAIERSAFGADTLSTHAIMRGGIMQLSRWGVLDDIVAAGTPPVKRTTFTYGDARVVLDIKDSAGVDALYAPRRTVLDSTLVTAARKAGASIHHGTSVNRLLWRGDRVIGVHATTEDGRSVELFAPLVIGADGIRSTVARHVDSPLTRVGRHLGGSVYGYWSDVETNGFEWVFRPDACAGVIPTNAGQVCVFAGATPARLGRGGVRVIEQFLAEGAPDIWERVRRGSPPKGTRMWSGHVGYMRQSYGAGWALVGDAGYFKDPISAHGLTDAMRDAELLARAVLADWRDGASLDALSHYQETRDGISGALFDITDRIASQQWNDAEISDLLIQLSASMNDELELLGSFASEVAA
jgi:2-polyprenyl-6-methoxyphenol hydroxylase-like FAD-dependent oxidoreductase